MKQRLLVGTAGLVAALAAMMWVAQGSPPKTTSSQMPRSPDVSVTNPSSPEPSPSAALSVAEQTDPRDLYSYAIPTSELQGLAPDVAPGSRLDLWVAWQPPVTERTDVQLLLEGVVLERIVPPVLPDGPHAAILQVPARKARRLIWGDRFGSLSVVAPTVTKT